MNTFPNPCPNPSQTHAKILPKLLPELCPHSCQNPGPNLQGLSVPFACVGSGDPVRVLRLYTTNTLDVLLKHLLLRHMYYLPLPILLCYAQALLSETSYCYCDCVTPSACVQVTLCECRVQIPRTVLCSSLYTACVDASRTVFWDRSNLLLEPCLNATLKPSQTA